MRGMIACAVLIVSSCVGATAEPITVISDPAPTVCPQVKTPVCAPPVKVVRVEHGAERPVARRHVNRVARRPDPLVRVVTRDPNHYDNPHRKIVTTRVCLDDGDGVTCRYNREFR